MLWHTKLVMCLGLKMQQGTLSPLPGESDHVRTGAGIGIGNKRHNVSGRSTESPAGETCCNSSPAD
ncbi:hypothetical protein HYC85_027963 [Camellia sinensis]|uniref:Uncharacterized protein n=1 Tax=Camellia sinensis TaxID=4442 RepID=A0A7J7FTY6_CAMSI|nr:hypothetical protein HYC85_027963 [Camellia sinensis]